ncbi:MAG TPA: PQQ-binding-like beta-propeller repeat protein, partial [Vicinamibacterales bacterium]
MKGFAAAVVGLVCVLGCITFWPGNSGAAQRAGPSGQEGAGARLNGYSPEWPTYNHDLAATRFSPLAQINPDNVGRLTPVWSYKLPVTVGPFGGSQAVPIVVDGVMYLPAGNRVLALEPETGKDVWYHEVKSGQVSRRGVSFWSGDAKTAARIFVMAGQRLIALDAKTGTPVEAFGKQGEVDTVVPYNSAPTIFRDIVMIGANVNEIPIGPPGDTRAYDARTGEKLWEFHTVPRAGELGNDTWGDGWKGRSGTNVWGFSMTVDESRGLAFMPVSGPAANYWGGDRPGNNLFANSIVAVDVRTGKYRWHFQTVHHDIWDADMPSVGGLVEIVRDGRSVAALAHIGKTGYMFILDRENGKPVFGVEERAVPKGDVPGEWYSPTQPFPLKPPPLTRVSFKKEDMVTAADTTPEHAAACQQLWEKSGGFYNAGPFTPFMFHKEGTLPRSTIQFPGGTGGVNWGGTATDPRSGYVFMNAHDTSLVGWVEVRKPGENYGFDSKGSPQPYDRAAVDGPGPFHTFSAPIKDQQGRAINLPCQKPPWARLAAVNANTGEIVWQVPLGLTEVLPEGKQNTGASGSAGPTVTAGGLVFIGATNDNRFRAFESKTGKELWVTKLERSGNANPISYQGPNGKQYVSIVASD